MKKISVFILALLGFVMNSNAQHQINSFFDEMGIVRLETQELKEASDTLVTVFHRSDDVVWSRVVYRIIDLRFKQNYQLYTPVSADDPVYASLFRTMLGAIEKGMPIYEKSSNIGDVKPYFTGEPLAKQEIPGLLNTDRTGDKDGNIATSDYMLLNYVNDSLKFNRYSYEDFARNTLKFMIQEVIFFDKHYSRVYSKILAIAPLNADNVVMNEGMSVMDALYGQILFWVPFDAFRPYMAQQYVTPRGSDTKRITFDDFFAQKMYSSYLVGSNNIYSRMIPQIANTYEEMQKEQERIETELLNVEQDLWEY
ncbi:MAG: gliding motility protein GldN [Paludibacteraceae bacterium]|jgi:gliding motility associated protien GldN|nr:gliding motility protein GldN [Paludibacteraceae bacterium]MBQ5774975.1 gliding motility protein GldN [Paludibacteraceae bacterium]